jgi:hypothetical protein
MAHAEYKTLVDDLKRDGVLTSSPLLYEHEDGRLECVSGHHRLEAAQDAGIGSVHALVITTPLSRERLIGLQLAHNRVVGQDDPNTLKLLYYSLPLDEKRYTGLTDDDFKDLKPIDVKGLSIGAPQYQSVELLFLPRDLPVIKEQLERVSKSKRALTLAADYADFDSIFDAATRVKRVKDIHNSALAFRVMAELAQERLDQLENMSNDKDF